MAPRCFQVFFSPKPELEHGKVALAGLGWAMLCLSRFVQKIGADLEAPDRAIKAHGSQFCRAWPRGKSPGCRR